MPEASARTIGVVVAGDNHLSPGLPRLTPPQRALRRERLRAGFGAAVAYALAHDARLFINTGDLFDSPTPSNQDRAFVADALGRLRAAGVVCVAIGGNHDTPRMLTEQGGESPQRVYTARDGLHYFTANDRLIPRLYTLDGLRVAIAGLTNNPVAPPGSDPLANIAVAAGSDAAEALAQAEIGLLIVHAAVEGLCRPNEGERIIAEASLAALPPIFRVVVAGHIHRYGRRRVGEREVIVVGATERMEFGASSGQAGFVWLELGAHGVTRAEHVSVAEQPRADLLLTTARLWPARPNSAAHDDDPLAIIRAEISAQCTAETITRLRLVGSLTRAQYHQLSFRDILLFGQERAFSFDLDTTGLAVVAPLPARPWLAAADVAQMADADAGVSDAFVNVAANGNTDAVASPGADTAYALSPAAELARLVAEWLAPSAADATSAPVADAQPKPLPTSGAGAPAAPADVQAAADLLLERLRGLA